MRPPRRGSYRAGTRRFGVEQAFECLSFRYWRFGVQDRDHVLRGWWDGDVASEHEFLGWNFGTVDAFVGVVIGTNGGTLERHAGEKTASPRVAEDFGTHGDIGFGGGGASDRTRGRRSISGQVHFAAENSVRASIIHDEKDEVGGLAAELQTKAPAFQGHHGWGAPMPIEICAVAASQRAAPVAAADDECLFQHRRKDHDTISLVQHILRNIVRDIHDFGKNGAAILQTIFIFNLVVSTAGRRKQQESDYHWGE